MKSLKNLVLALIIIVIGNLIIIAQDSSETVLRNHKFINGKWFDGKEFKKRTFYSVNGVFSKNKPKQLDETVDLKNAYILPPFGDAHNHTVELNYNLKSFGNKMLEQGIFYVKNPNSVPRFTKQIEDKIIQPNTIDATFSGGGLTATDGHPVALYDGLAKGPFSWAKIDSFEGLAYFIIDDEKDLAAKWNRIISQKPDFIKTYLLFSEDYEKNLNEQATGSTSAKAKGLNPRLLPLIVKKAHAAGLRVSTHVNSAYDFGVAVRAGVDEINHLPGRSTITTDENFERYRIKEEDAKIAGKKGVYVVPTYSLFLGRETKFNDEDYSVRVRDLQRYNLRLLNKHGVKITFGPDTYNATSQKEAFYIKSLGIFSNLELIKMWSEYTPQTIFPKRRIAKLKNGYEASFIAMSKNPLKNFDTVRKINYRFKQGIPIQIEISGENKK